MFYDNKTPLYLLIALFVVVAIGSFVLGKYGCVPHVSVTWEAAASQPAE